MYKLNEPIIHNNYKYKLVKAGKIINEGVVYNEASSRNYVADIGANKANGTTLYAVYRTKTYDENGSEIWSEETTAYGQPIRLVRTTVSEEINFGTNIQFKGTVEFSPGTFSGLVIKFGLGGRSQITENNTKISDLYWSEAGTGINKDYGMTLIVECTFNITVSAPNASHYYAANISSLLQKETGYLPAPGIDRFYLSSLNLTGLPQVLTKKIPSLCSLPAILTSSYSTREPAFRAKNPDRGDRAGYYLLPAEGKVNPQDVTIEYNYGVIRTMVFGDVFAERIGSGGSVSSVIPVIKFNKEKLQSLLQSDVNEIYCYCSVPEGCEYDGIVLNNNRVDTSITDISFTDPKELTNVAIIGVGLSETDEPKSIENYQNTTTGEYYANYIFSTGIQDSYWEPPYGSPVCPRFIYFNTDATNVRTGSCSVVIYKKIADNNDAGFSWKYVVTCPPYSTRYFQEEDAIQYRADVNTSLQNSSTGFFLNELEKEVIPLKSYEPCVLRIGDSNNDFGKSGIRISRRQLESWNNLILDEQTDVTTYTVGLKIIANQVLYKARDIIVYLKYEVSTNG